MYAQSHRRSISYPPLSLTYSSHQLWTPLNLERITINEQKYHDYLKQDTSTNPSHLNAISKRVQKYGDNSFVHKDIPVEQHYDLTTLKRSNVRPWDQLISRPLISQDVLNKESYLPFPSEHPYASHISQFALFPDANNSIEATRCKEDKLSECCFKEAGVQTDISGVDMQLPLPLSLEESSFLVCAKAFSSGIRIEREVPVLIDKANFKTGIYRWDISRAQSRGHQRCWTYPAPKNIFSRSSKSNSFILSPNTFNALQHVNRSVSTCTTYQREFSPLPTAIFEKPQTSNHESRGKYANAPNFLFKGMPHINGDIIMIDQSTQTRSIDYNDIDSRPLSRESFLNPTTGGSSFVNTNSFSLLLPHCKSEAVKLFHQMYPDNVPNIHSNSSQTSRRHVINGYHAYYWH